jgi:hypothetical protein
MSGRLKRVVAGVVALALVLASAPAVSQGQPGRIQVYRCKLVNDSGVDLQVVVAGFYRAVNWQMRKGASQRVDISTGDKVVFAYDLEKQTLVGGPFKVTITDRTVITLGKDVHNAAPIKDEKPREATPKDAKPKDAKPKDAKPKDDKPKDDKPKEG